MIDRDLAHDRLNATRVDARLMATARLWENLAAVAHDVRRQIAVGRAYADGHVDAVPGGRVQRDTDQWTRPAAAPTGCCVANVPDAAHPDELVDCGNERPCPLHDAPVQLTPTERAAERRLALDKWRDEWEERITFAATVAHQALADAHRFLGHHAPPDDPVICAGYPVGEECTNLAGYDPDHEGRARLRKNRLCDECEIARATDERDERRARHARSARISRRS